MNVNSETTSMADKPATPRPLQVPPGPNELGGLMPIFTGEAVAEAARRIRVEKLIRRNRERIAEIHQEIGDLKAAHFKLEVRTATETGWVDQTAECYSRMVDAATLLQDAIALLECGTRNA